jgi:hypothetical protein
LLNAATSAWSPLALRLAEPPQAAKTLKTKMMFQADGLNSEKFDVNVQVPGEPNTFRILAVPGYVVGAYVFCSLTDR